MSPRLTHRSRERPARVGCFVSRRSEERLRQYPLFACPSCHGVVLIVAFITQASVIDQFRAHHRTRAARAPPESNSHPDVASVDVADVGVVQHAGAIRAGGHELHFAGTKGEFHRRPAVGGHAVHMPPSCTHPRNDMRSPAIHWSWLSATMAQYALPRLAAARKTSRASPVAALATMIPHGCADRVARTPNRRPSSDTRKKASRDPSRDHARALSASVLGAIQRSVVLLRVYPPQRCACRDWRRTRAVREGVTSAAIPRCREAMAWGWTPP